MVPFSMRCPKCGLIQARNPTCKVCGTAVGQADEAAPSSGAAAPAARRVEPAPAPAPSPLPRSPAAPAPITAGTDEARHLTFHGSGGTPLGIHTVNVLLTIVTLGIYSFWARVRMRGYLLSQTEFEGDRFAYHGTGRELFNGSLKAGLIFGLPVVLLNVAPELLGAGDAVKTAAALLIYCLFMVFLPFAMRGARRYRLSRTSWRSIRFSFRGRVLDFVKLFIGGSLLSLVTLGAYYPIFDVRRYAFMISHSYFGNQKFEFDGQGRDLLWSYLAAVPLSLLTLGIYWFWFLAKKQRYLMDHTSFATARFHSTVTGGALCLLYLMNFILLLATLGIAWPWVVARTTRFNYAYISLNGALDVAAIQQEAQAASATGEGLAGFLDLDLDLG